MNRQTVTEVYELEKYTHDELVRLDVAVKGNALMRLIEEAEDAGYEDGYSAAKEVYAEADEDE